MTFPQHLEVLMDFYGSERTYGIQANGRSALVVPVILSNWDLDAQQKLFKLTMNQMLFK
jgi:hypothetical protein